MVNESRWCLDSRKNFDDSFIDNVIKWSSSKTANYLSQLLWERSICNERDLSNWFSPSGEIPSNEDWEKEIRKSIKILDKANQNQEKVAIWGGLTIDSFVAVTILLKGLTGFFCRENTVSHHFYPRNNYHFTLNKETIQKLSIKGIKVIIMVGMEWNSMEEINFAHSLGIDIIIINTGIFFFNPPPVEAWLNPCGLLPIHHPYYSLSLVSVTYLLMEKLQDELSQNLNTNDLLHLVAIGILAEKASVKGYNRYLLQEGLEKLKTAEKFLVSKLVDYCKNEKCDRPSDIDHGIGAIIRGIGEVSQDGKFLVEILNTSSHHTNTRLSEQGKRAYHNYLDIKYQILQDARNKLKFLDLSLPQIVILTGNNWHLGVLESVAEIISLDIGLPVILLSSQRDNVEENEGLYLGYGYGLPQFNLPQLIFEQRDLLEDFTLDVTKIRLSLAKDNLTVFSHRINREIKNKYSLDSFVKVVNIDLEITLSDVGNNLNNELRLLEPFSVDNPPPNFLIRNCWFTNIYEKKFINSKSKSVKGFKGYRNLILKANIHDDSDDKGYSCIWWGKNRDKLKENNSYDVVVKLKHNFGNNNNPYRLEIVDIKHHHPDNCYTKVRKFYPEIIDYRHSENNHNLTNNNSPHIVSQCPLYWQEISHSYQSAIAHKENLTLAYAPPKEENINDLWDKFVTLVKNSLKNNQPLELKLLLNELNINSSSFWLILEDLKLLGVNYEVVNTSIFFIQVTSQFSRDDYKIAQRNFHDIIHQENLQKRYFHQVKVDYLTQELIKI